MKIALIGVGTASAISASTLVSYLPIDVEIVCLYNPDIPITHVGESASAAIYGLIYDAVRFDPLQDLNEIDGTLRFCTKYSWQAAHGNDFTIRYAAPGLHVNSEKFSWFVFKRLEKLYTNFSLVKADVSKINSTDDSVTIETTSGNYTVDYVIDCRGTPNAVSLNSDQYAAPEFESVNSVMLFPEFKKYDEPYTSSYIHDNGWMFGVPLQHRKAWGYLYNNKITSLDEAAKDFSRIKGIDTEPLRKFSWRPYYKKQAMVDRVLSMGNRLYFFEPHQAIPLHFYLLLTKRFAETTLQTNDSTMITESINQLYSQHIEVIQDLIAINYSGENKLTTDFWTYAQRASRQRLHNSMLFRQWAANVLQFGISGFGLHNRELMREYITGYKINLEKILKE